MTIAAQRLLASFEALPDDDKQAVAVEILRRTADDTDSSPGESSLLFAAHQVFLDLDRREEQED
jgi:hypothetical protein